MPAKPFQKGCLVLRPIRTSQEIERRMPVELLRVPISEEDERPGRFAQKANTAMDDRIGHIARSRQGFEALGERAAAPLAGQKKGAGRKRRCRFPLPWPARAVLGTHMAVAAEEFGDRTSQPHRDLLLVESMMRKSCMTFPIPSCGKTKVESEIAIPIDRISLRMI